MRNRFLFIVLILLVTGCSSGLKSRWGNFTAYYNTFYNAKKSFNTGLQRVQDADLVYNPQLPIRVHQRPINVGAQDFQNTIDKGAEILRKHADTKWVDDALFLIGKSYFYKSEFFSAEQKFQELILTTEDQELLNQAKLWRSRVLLEMELYSEGIQYISEELLKSEEELDVVEVAEFRLLLSQYYVEQQNWETAIRQLEFALPNIEHKEYSERGYFLLGQLFERIGSPQDAYYAYSMVGEFYTDYDLQYLAQRKKAESARDLGNPDIALRTFSGMLKDDKNTEYKVELEYELALTQQNKGNLEEAEERYKSLLYNRNFQPTAELKALSYYRLAEVYRFGFNDLEMAAAYYDTASRQNANPDELPFDFAANELAKSFGEYTRLKQELDNKDSLLWVSELPQESFDSLLVELKKQKLSELEAERNAREQRANTIVNVADDEGQSPTTGANGFLNIANPELIANSKAQFQAIWGNRPLVDNWRVQSIMASSTQASNPTVLSNNQTSENTSISSIDVSIDLSEVPFEAAEKEKMRSDISNLKYQLGNLFYISLNMEDSAEVYFKRVIAEHPDATEVPVSLYSLSELKASQGYDEEAMEYANQLIRNYPNAIYAQRIATEYGIDISEGDEVEEGLSVFEQFKALQEDTMISVNQRINALISLARENDSNAYADNIFYEAIQWQVSSAKSDSLFSVQLLEWHQAKQSFNQQKKALDLQKDEARTALSDTTLSQSDRQQYQSVIDSTLRFDSNENFPYEGVKWDRTRDLLNEFVRLFNNSELLPKVRILNDEIALSKPPQEMQTAVSNTNMNAEMTSCSSLNITPRFLSDKSEFRNQMESITTQKSVPVIVQINRRGGIESSQLLENQGEKIDARIQELLTESLAFSPYLVNNQATPVSCSVDLISIMN